MSSANRLEHSLKPITIPEHLPSATQSTVRSFVRRAGRITAAQQRALLNNWQQFGIESGPTPLDANAVFGRNAPLILEIGFGNGESLANQALAQPEYNYLGIEVHRPGVGHLLLRAAQLQLTNLRILCADAVQVLAQQVPDQSLARIQIFFPDPWPKLRHHKRRLVQAQTLPLFMRKLQEHGQLHIATDCRDYADAMLELLNATAGWTNAAIANGFVERPAWRSVTKFEQRGLRLGHEICDLLFITGQ